MNIQEDNKIKVANAIKERNHFIPKTYLEKFLNGDNKLYVYKKGKEFFEKGITKKERLIVIEGKNGLNNIAVKKKLYIPEGDFSGDGNIFEDFFSEEVEGKYNDFLAFAEANFSDAQTVFGQYRTYIILLIASMMSRTCTVREKLRKCIK